MIRVGLVALALTLVVAACGDDPAAEELPPIGDTAGGAASTCPEGTADCEDTLFPGDEPNDGLAPGGGSAGMPAGDGLSVAEALAGDVTGIILVSGFYVDSGTGPRLCEALAESFPPQCGGPSIPLADTTMIDPESIRAEQGTSWTDEWVIVVGEIVDGILVPTPTSL